MRAALMVSLACAGCATDLEKQSEVVKLRVLAVRADPAELVVTDGGVPPRATFTALAVEPSGAPTSVRFALCIDQNPTPSPTLDCPGAQGVDLPPAGDTSAVFDLGDPRFLPVLSASADGGTPDAAVLQEGIAVIIGFAATAPAHTEPDGGPAGADGGPLQIVRGYTTIVVHDDSRPANRNPDLASIRIGPDGGVDIAADGTTAVPPSSVQRLTPVPAPDAKEATADGPEKLGYSFFATAGSLSSLRSTDTTATGEPADTFVDWTAPSATGPLRLWVVVRDGRGGTAFLERSISVSP
ncbi:MAG: hypothetical protein E6J61_14450 [Deltaproteobacteria bacterium]|nr:MAG: hypothetical protein E6J61_14450 [Deltaproteobacteria bacterium]